MRFLGAKYAKNAFAAGAPPGTLQGRLQHSSRHPSWTKWKGRAGKERERQKIGGEERKGKGREGGITVHLFPHFEP